MVDNLLYVFQLQKKTLIKLPFSFTCCKILDFTQKNQTIGPFKSLE